MKFSRSDVVKKAYALPELKFENQTLTSFAGLVVFQKLFIAMRLKTRLSDCFRHFNGGKVFNRSTMFLQLIVHLLLGFRELQDCRYYNDDPLVKRLLGLRQLPDVATVSRFLKETGATTVENLRCLLREMVLDRGRNGSRIQQEEKRRTQLLSFVLHVGSDGSGVRFSPPSRQRTRLERRERLYFRVYRRGACCFAACSD